MLVHRKGELGLRIVGVDEERRAPVHIGAQYAQSCISRTPRLHHNIIEFITQEVLDHPLVARFYL